MAKKKVGLVDLPDEAMDVFNHYTQSNDWRLELVINTGSDSAAKRSARILGVPVKEMPSMEYLEQCDLVVIGDDSSPQYAPIREMLAGTDVSVMLLDELRRKMSAGEPVVKQKAAPDPGAGLGELEAEVDFALDHALNMGIPGDAPEPVAEPEPAGEPAAGFGWGSMEPQETPVDPSAGMEGSEESAPVEPGNEIDRVLDDFTLADPQAPEEIAGHIEFVGTEPKGAIVQRGDDEPEQPADLEEDEEPATFDISAEMERPAELEGLIQAEEPAEVGLEPEATTFDLTSEMEDEDEAFEIPSGLDESDQDETLVDEPEPVTVLKEAELEETLVDEPEPGEPVMNELQADDMSGEFEAIGASVVIEETPEPSSYTSGATVVEEEEVVEIWAEGSDLDPKEETQEIPRPEGLSDEIGSESPAVVDRAFAGVEEVLATDAGPAEPEIKRGFDASILLGRELAQKLGPVQVDAESSKLRELLESILEATGARTGSVMLPEWGADQMRIATAVGLSDEIIAKSRPTIGEGLVGKAFATGESQTHQVEVPNLAEAGGSQQYRLAASVPIHRDGQTLGVLTVNVESLDPVSREDLLGELAGYVNRFPAAILEAVDLSSLDLENKEQILTRHLDRIMAQEIGFNDRLLAVGEVLRNTFSADFMHLYVLVPGSGNMELITEPQGVAAAGGTIQPSNRGLLGRMLKSGKSRLVSIPDIDDGQELGTAYLTINANRPYGLLVLESFLLKTEDKKAIDELLSTVVRQIEDIFEVEQGVETQDILSAVRIRITDRLSSLNHLPAESRTQPALDMVIQELNGKAAIWVPGPGERPVSAQPHDKDSAKILADAWDTLEEMSSWIRGVGSAASGASGPGWDAAGPQGPAPYAGAKDPGSDGVLLVFFAPDMKGVPSSRLPARVLSEALFGVCSVIQESKAGSDSDSGTVVTHDSDSLLTSEELEDRIREEVERTQRTGLAFALTRFKLESVTEDQIHFLRHFMLTNKRAVDVVAEFDDGTFVLLSPDTSPSDDRIQQRFRDLWQERGSESSLTVDRYEGRQQGLPPMEDAA